MRPRNLPILLHGSTVLRTYIQTTVLIVIHHKHRMNFLIVTDLNNSVDDDPLLKTMKLMTLQTTS